MDGGKLAGRSVSPARHWEWALQAYQRGQPERARQALEPLLAQPAADGECLFLAGLVEVQAGDLERAVGLLADAVAADPGRLERRLALAGAQRQLAHDDDAVDTYQALLAREPRHAPAWHDLGTTYQELGCYGEALDCHDRALAIAPEFAEPLRARPGLLARLGRPEAARIAYVQLLERWPDDVAIRVEYAEFLERSHRPADAAAHLPEAGPRTPPALTARIAALRSRLLEREGAREQALELVTAERRRTGVDWLSYREGQLLHEAGCPDRAMRAFRRANAARGRARAFRRWAQHPLEERLDAKIRAGFETAPPVPDGGRPAPAFLLGLPRSGTTLLDRMLGAHSEIQVLEEPASLQLAERYLERGADPREARRAYWRHVDGFARTERPRLIDKNPLHALHLDVLARIFPEAPVIIVLRHPYDAALSCFMQDFGPNPASQRFLDLHATGWLCRRMVTLMRMYERTFPGRTVRVHYEHLVADYRGELEGVLAALGCEWDEQIAQFSARTGFVTTPSYAQVARGLYDDSIGRWREYARWLDPLRETLGPLLNDLGYEE